MRLQTIGKSKRLIRGFTIVELLIVIVVIGILATLTVIAYGNIQGQARDRSLQSDIDALDGQETNYGLKNNIGGKAWYSGSGVDSDLKFTPSQGNIIDIVVNSTDYCIRAYNPASATYKTLATAAIKESSNGACATLSPSAAAQADSPIPLQIAYSTDFESGFGIWSDSHTDSTLTVSTDVAHSGTQSLKLVHTDTWVIDGSGNGSGDLGDGIRATVTGLVVGKQYTFTGWVYTTTAGSGTTTDASWDPISPSVTITSQVAPTLAANVWTKVTATFVATDTSQYIFLNAQNHEMATVSNNKTRTVYFDDISVTY